MARRHKLDIIAEILTLCKNGSKKTRLVYGANINFKMLRKYQTLLENKRFITTMNGRIYTTYEGFEFLKDYKKMRLAWGFNEEEKLAAEEDHITPLLTDK
jgi:predicted transcriptional regulator